METNQLGRIPMRASLKVTSTGEQNRCAVSTAQVVSTVSSGGLNAEAAVQDGVRWERLSEEVG